MSAPPALLRPDPFTGFDWSAIFGRRAPLEVEIGFGKDTFLIDRAERQPEVDHLGVEYSRKRAESFLRKAERRGVTNVRATRLHAAVVLDRLLPAEGVRAIHVLFPDPWPKKKHHKNRLIRAPFARAVHRCLESGGTLTLGTDDVDYREQMLEVMEGHGAFANVHGARRWVPEIPDHPKTIFEERWRRHGRAIHFMRFRKEQPWTVCGGRGEWRT
jgi:tRNA (guanine-N7-)-methyltransferase